jgi:DNA polymerase-3 subunit beta
LTAVSKVVEGRNTIPILSNVLLSVDSGRLTIKGTDLDIEASASVPVMDAGDGATTVDAKLLTDIVKKASGDVTLDLDGDVMSVKSGRSRYRLQTLPASDYPDMTAGTFTTEFDADLSELFAPVQFAISTEETRYYLNGIYLHVIDGRLVAVATDGHRLARNYGPAAADFPGIIIPRKAVSILPKGNVTVRLSANKIQFATADTVITSKLIDGTFPDYQRVIPTGNDKIVTFDLPAMKQAAERVSVISSERGRAVRLAIAENQIVLSVNNADTGSATEEIAVAYEGEPIEIGFNSAYLLDVMAQFPAGDVKMALNDSGSPTLFTSDKAEGLLAVLMPMRV